MHDYTTIIGVIELRADQQSYDTVQRRYRIGRSGISLIMNRFKDSGLSLEDLKQMSPGKVVDLIYPAIIFVIRVSLCRILKRSMRR